MNIVDTHCHLNDETLYSQREYYINDAISKGINKLVIVGYDLESSKLAIQICKEFPNSCYALIGIHPSEITDNFDNELLELENLINETNVIGIGEIGLDYHYEGYDKDKQIDCFIKQVKLANKYNLPISIHTRDAINDTVNILKDNCKYIKNGGIMHCFSESKEIAISLISLGFYFSFGGPLTFKNGRVAKETIKYIPLDKLLFETDSPYLAPHPLRGTTNFPSNVLLVLKEASLLLDINEEELASIESANFKRLFKL